MSYSISVSGANAADTRAKVEQACAGQQPFAPTAKILKVFDTVGEDMPPECIRAFAAYGRANDSAGLGYMNVKVN